MFKAAKDGPAKVITANDLRSGLVVFLDSDGGWTVDIAGARVLEDGPDLEGGLARAKVETDAQVVLDAYAIDVVVIDGVPVPVRLRERIRAERGPTVVYGETERAKLRQEATSAAGASGIASNQQTWTAESRTGTR